jgi:hypothetical protein
MAQIAHFFDMCSSVVLKDDGALSYRTTAKIAKSENIFSYMQRQPIEAVGRALAGTEVTPALGA